MMLEQNLEQNRDATVIPPTLPTHAVVEPPPLRVDTEASGGRQAVIETIDSIDSTRLLAIIESGDDLFDSAEAPAAIAGVPDDDDGGGSRFFRVERISESVASLVLDASVVPLASNDVTGGGRAEADLPRLGSLALAADMTSPIEVTLPPVVQPPISARLQVLEDHTLNGNVFSGASNAQGDPISIVQFVVNGQTYPAGATASILDASRPTKWQTVGTIKVDGNGDYTFVPSADWNGAVPEIIYTLTDGTNLRTDTLEIDVIPVNDQPTSLHGAYHASVAAGESYVFQLSDFPVRDDKDADVNGVYVAPTEVVITALPPYGGTLVLDGHPVVVGTRVTRAELQAGKLEFKVDADYNGTSLLPFYFRVDDGGGTDNGGIAESNPYTFRLNVDQIIVGNNASSSGQNNSGEGIYGGFGKDIIIGDAGGVETRQIAATDKLNIALVLDLNAFTSEKFSRSTSPLTKAQALKDAVSALLHDQLLTHAGKVNLSLITFDGATSTGNISVIDLDANDVTAILNIMDGLTGSINSQADYVSAFNTAKAWFDLMAGSYPDYQNTTFFLTDSLSNGNADDQLNAFNSLKQISAVHAIDLGQYDPGHVWSSKDRVAQYDTTDTRMVADVSRYNVHADFQTTAGANSFNAWEVSSTGHGFMQIENGRMIIAAESSANYVSQQPVSTVVTQQEAHKMVVTDPDGAYFSFRIPGWNMPYTDTFSWRLLKWDVMQADWVVAETGGAAIGNFLSTNPTMMTSLHPPGDYRFQFEAHSSALWGYPGKIQIDDIRIHKPVLEGSPWYVRDPDELSAAFTIHGTIIQPVGDDWIETALVGDSIVFGDAMNTDRLPWGENGNPTKPADKHGLDALTYFLQASLGHAPTHAEIFDYIWTNHSLFNVNGDTHGGKDFIQLGERNAIAYGGGGDDTIYGGVGGNHILYGGTGNDYLRAGSGTSRDILIGGPGNDTLQADGGDTLFVWLDGDAGTVAAPAVDKVYGFSLDRGAQHARDTLDLRDLLIGEENSTEDLTGYLHISLGNISNAGGPNNMTVIKVSSTGQLQTDGSNFDQQINLHGIDLTGGLTDQQQMIKALIQSGTLLLDSQA